MTKERLEGKSKRIITFEKKSFAESAMKDFKEAKLHLLKNREEEIKPAAKRLQEKRNAKGGGNSLNPCSFENHLLDLNAWIAFTYTKLKRH